MFGIEDVGRDLRPVHPAALRLAGVVEYARCQLQLGFCNLIRRGCGSEIRHRIVGRVQALGGGVLEPCDHALGAGGEGTALRPQRREVSRGVEFLDRGPLALAVEIAQRFGAQHIAQLVRDRLIGRRDVACGLDRLGRRGRGDSRRSRGGCAIGRLRLGGFLGRADRRLCRIGHRRGGIHFEIGGGRGRDVGRFGSRYRRLDREFSGAAAGRSGLRQCRGRGHRKKGCCNGHQYAVIPGTALRTVRHRHTPWAKLLRHGTVLDGFGTAIASVQLSLKRRPCWFWSTIQQRDRLASERVQIFSSVLRLHATIHTQTIHAPP